MIIPASLSDAFGHSFQSLLGQFLSVEGYLRDATDLSSVRFLARSVVPHIERLSARFNRLEQSASLGLEPYWGQSSHPRNLRLAYLLGFMPPNLVRTAAIWAELHRFGYRFPAGPFRALELGSGPGSATAGIISGEYHAPLGIPPSATFALIEQDRGILELGQNWCRTYADSYHRPGWSFQPFHRRLDLQSPLLPPRAPQFQLWLMSYTLNEWDIPAEALAERLLESWENHLAEEALVILVEPALKTQSRRLLELRAALLKRLQSSAGPPLQVLLPCLGHQACGALADPEDWCHEALTWWRPPYLQALDRLTRLDHKILPFSYLVLARSQRSREELLPVLRRTSPRARYRLVSPAYPQGRTLEYYVCGDVGKQRARSAKLEPASVPSLPAISTPPGDLERGAVITVDSHSGLTTPFTLYGVKQLAPYAGSPLPHEGRSSAPIRAE